MARTEIAGWLLTHKTHANNADLDVPFNVRYWG